MYHKYWDLFVTSIVRVGGRLGDSSANCCTRVFIQVFARYLMPAARNDLVKYPIEFKIYCVPNCLGTAGGSAHPVHFENMFYSHRQADLFAQGSGIFLPLAF